MGGPMSDRDWHGATIDRLAGHTDYLVSLVSEAESEHDDELVTVLQRALMADCEVRKLMTKRLAQHEGTTTRRAS